MKTILSQKQTIELFKLGIPVEKATEKVYTEISDSGRYYQQPAFTLTDLLDILPKWIDTPEDRYSFAIQRAEMGEWVAGFRRVAVWTMYWKYVELIDALYELACWYYGEFLKK